MENATTVYPPMSLQPASTLKPLPTDWLWPGYLALGSLAILDGDPGMGKSLVTLDLTARLTTGRPWPERRAWPRARLGHPHLRGGRPRTR